MSNWLNYHHLYYFKTIAEEGSVSAAAKKLRVGQPTLSAQLKLFEETLDVVLFERHHKKLMLTEQGRVALEYAKNIFRLGSEMSEVLQDEMKPNKTSLHLGALDSVSKNMTVALVREALKVADCQITLSEGHPSELLRELRAHRIDLVLTNSLPTGFDAQNIYARSISRQNVSVYAAPKYKNLKKDFPQSISGQPFILPTYDSQLRQDLEHWAQMNKISFNTVVETQDIAVKKLMAQEGFGLIPSAPQAVRHLVDAGELIEIGKLKDVHEELFLISGKRKIENRIAASLMQKFRI